MSEGGFTYLLFVKADQPVDHVVKHVDAVSFFLDALGRVSPVNSGDSFVLPPLAKGRVLGRDEQARPK